jgi:hypothetical protein
LILKKKYHYYNKYNYNIKNVPPIIIVYFGPILDSRKYPIVLNKSRVTEFIGPNMKVSLVVNSG